jgi:hypothetical protein
MTQRLTRVVIEVAETNDGGRVLRRTYLSVPKSAHTKDVVVGKYRFTLISWLPLRSDYRAILTERTEDLAQRKVQAHVLKRKVTWHELY